MRPTLAQLRERHEAAERCGNEPEATHLRELIAATETLYMIRRQVWEGHASRGQVLVVREILEKLPPLPEGDET